MNDREWGQQRQRSILAAFNTGRPVLGDSNGVLHFADGAKENLPPLPNASVIKASTMTKPSKQSIDKLLWPLLKHQFSYMLVMFMAGWSPGLIAGTSLALFLVLIPPFALLAFLLINSRKRYLAFEQWWLKMYINKVITRA